MPSSLPLWANLAVFAAPPAVVWAAGTRIAGYADAIAERTGIGRAVLGMMLLGGVTSLPELAVASTAAIAGHPGLSVNDLLGSAVINVLIIALADAFVGRDAITSVVASPPVLLQGVLGIVLLAVVAAAAISVDRLLLGVSAWSWALLGLYGASVWLLARSRSERAWKPLGARGGSTPAAEGEDGPSRSLRLLGGKTAAAAAAVLVGGFFLAKSAEAIAAQTGLGTNIVGAVMLAASTSLPEASTVIAAVRLRRYEMAIADVFGTNLFNVTIIFVADALYDGGPVLSEVGTFAAFGALLAIVLTALYLAGMIERRDRTVLRMGFDSLAAMAVYVCGVAVLYQLK
jgi:cation:H+ antiporter